MRALLRALAYWLGGGPSVSALEMEAQVGREQSRYGLTVQTAGDGTCQRDYEEAA